MFTANDLKKKFRYFNKTYFNNELPMITLKAPKRRTTRRFGTFIYSFSINPKPRILVYNLTQQIKGENGWENTLLHEMVHYYLWTKYVKDEIKNYLATRTLQSRRKLKRVSRLSGHTPEFYALLNKYWNMEKGESKTPEKKRTRIQFTVTPASPNPISNIRTTPVPAPTSSNAPTLGQVIDTMFGKGKISRIMKGSDYYFVYATLSNGNTTSMKLAA